jgi:hypothetical protein
MVPQRESDSPTKVRGSRNRADNHKITEKAAAGMQDGMERAIANREREASPFA